MEGGRREEGGRRRQQAGRLVRGERMDIRREAGEDTELDDGGYYATTAAAAASTTTTTMMTTTRPNWEFNSTGEPD